MTRCDMRTMHECSCEANECRAQHIGTWVKPRPSPCQPSVRMQIATGAFIAAMAFIAFMTFNKHEAERARAEQEITFHD